MAKQKRPRTPVKKARAGSPPEDAAPSAVRIIGGKHRGRKLTYSGDLRTRPMKDRVREAVFNLIGAYVPGKHAVDLFAGTGALGLEAISRGAAAATLFERHFPTAYLLMQNCKELGEQDTCEVIAANTLLWFRKPTAGSRLLQPDGPGWIVFCSPPWSLFHDSLPAMLDMLNQIAERAPAESIFVIEGDKTFDFTALAHLGQWDIREYPPASIGIMRKASTDHPKDE